MLHNKMSKINPESMNPDFFKPTSGIIVTLQRFFRKIKTNYKLLSFVKIFAICIYQDNFFMILSCWICQDRFLTIFRQNRKKTVLTYTTPINSQLADALEKSLHLHSEL